jgi:hypothetical protein
MSIQFNAINENGQFALLFKSGSPASLSFLKRGAPSDYDAAPWERHYFFQE